MYIPNNIKLGENSHFMFWYVWGTNLNADYCIKNFHIIFRELGLFKKRIILFIHSLPTFDNNSCEHVYIKKDLVGCSFCTNYDIINHSHRLKNVSSKSYHDMINYFTMIEEEFRHTITCDLKNNKFILAEEYFAGGQVLLAPQLSTLQYRLKNMKFEFVLERIC